MKKYIPHINFLAIAAIIVVAFISGKFSLFFLVPYSLALISYFYIESNGFCIVVRVINAIYGLLALGQLLKHSQYGSNEKLLFTFVFFAAIPVFNSLYLSSSAKKS